MTITIQGRSLIGSRSRAPGGTLSTQFSANWRNAGAASSFCHATEEVDLAVQLATEAFVVYGNLPAKPKAKFLKTIARRLEEIAEQLVNAPGERRPCPRRACEANSGAPAGNCGCLQRCWRKAHG